MVNLKLSFLSYSMARTAGFTADKMVALAGELEMDGIDWVSTHGHTARHLKRLCDRAGLPVVCYTFFCDAIAQGPFGIKEADHFKRQLDTALILEAPLIMIPTPGNHLERNVRRKMWIEGLKRIMPLVRDARLRLSLENFPGPASPFVTADDFKEAQKDLPDLRLTFDSGNCLTGEAPVPSYRRCAASVVHAHFKDYRCSAVPRRGYRRMLSGRYYAPALPGQGAVDFKALLEAMRENRYQGYIDIEYEGNTWSPEEAMRKTVRYVRELWTGI